MDDQKKDDPKAGDKPAAEGGTGTVFAPATADPSVNPYDLAQSANAGQPAGSPPPVFSQPTPPLTGTNPAAPAAAAAAPQLSSDQSGDLIAIKQQALQNLTPLIDELQQTPEDKFKTMMMLIQASDNPQLIKKAYDAASAITDEKGRAQALLDVVNEINYFTHQSQSKNNQPSTIA